MDNKVNNEVKDEDNTEEATSTRNKLDNILAAMDNLTLLIHENSTRLSKVEEKLLTGDGIEKDDSILNADFDNLELGMTQVKALVRESNGDNNSNDEQSNASNDDKVKGGRRDSRLITRFKMMEETTKKMTPVYQYTQPSCSHLKLDKESPVNVFGFINGVNKYTSTTGFPLRLQNHIGDNIVKLIIQKCRITKDEYYASNTVDIKELLMKLIKPATKDEFLNHFGMMLKFKGPTWGTARSTNTKQYLLAVEEYIEDSIVIFELLAEANRTNIPSINDKKLGLVALFKKGLDKDYIERTLCQVDKNNYRDYYEFVRLLTEQVRKHTLAYEQTEILPYTFDNNKSIVTEQDTKRNHYEKRKREIGRDIKHRVHNVYEEPESHSQNDIPDLIDSESSDSDDSDNDDCDNEIQSQIVELIDYASNIKETTQEVSEQDINDTMYLNAMERTMLKTLPCFRQASKQDCPYGDKCKYSHDEQLLASRRKEAGDFKKNRTILKRPPDSSGRHN